MIQVCCWLAESHNVFIPCPRKKINIGLGKLPMVHFRGKLWHRQFFDGSYPTARAVTRPISWSFIGVPPNCSRSGKLDRKGYWQASHTGDAAKVKGSRKGMHISTSVVEERARAGVTFCLHARPVNWFKNVIKSQEKNAWKRCKNQCFSSVVFTQPCVVFASQRSKNAPKPCYVHLFTQFSAVGDPISLFF